MATMHQQSHRPTFSMIMMEVRRMFNKTLENISNSNSALDAALHSICSTNRIKAQLFKMNVLIEQVKSYF